MLKQSLTRHQISKDLGSLCLSYCNKLLMHMQHKCCRPIIYNLRFLWFNLIAKHLEGQIKCSYFAIAKMPKLTNPSFHNERYSTFRAERVKIT